MTGMCGAKLNLHTNVARPKGVKTGSSLPVLTRNGSHRRNGMNADEKLKTPESPPGSDTSTTFVRSFTELTPDYAARVASRQEESHLLAR